MLALAPLVVLASARYPVNLGVVTCSEQSTIIVERFGRYHRSLQPGIHFCMPWPIESLRRFQLRERPCKSRRSQKAHAVRC